MQQQFACSRCPSGKLSTYPTTNLSLLLTSLPDSKICVNNPLMDSFQFNEAFLVLRAPNWTQYPLVSMAGREQCCSHPTHCLLGPPELLLHQAPPAWSPAAGTAPLRSHPTPCPAPAQLLGSQLKVHQTWQEHFRSHRAVRIYTSDLYL